jgi:hypothetical protein
MPGLVQYRMKAGIFSVQYQIEIMNAGLPMPALVCSMPMPSYDNLTQNPSSASKKCLT